MYNEGNIAKIDDGTRSTMMMPNSMNRHLLRRQHLNCISLVVDFKESSKRAFPRILLIFFLFCSTELKDLLT